VSEQARQFDVAVVGAGPAGSTAAAQLARAGHRVVLLEKATFPRDKPCAEYLSPATEPLLRGLGVLDEIEASQPSRLRGFRVYAPGGGVFQGDYAATRDAEGHSLFETGLAVPRIRLDALLSAAAQRAGADLREGWRLGRIARVNEGAGSTYVLSAAPEAEPIRARLVVAADGLHSTVAQRLGLHVQGRLRKVALVAHTRGITGLSDYGEMHVAGRRYVGVAPLEPASMGDLCNVAMVVDEARDGRAVAGRPEAFLLDALGAFPGLRDRVRGVRVTRSTLTVSRLSVRARRLSDDGLLLVGDAAGYYDPFTGEGIYQALRSGELAAATADRCLAAGDISAQALSSYDRLYRQEFRGKRAVETIVQTAVHVPPFMDHLARILARRKHMADAVVAVTGDFLPPSAVLRPGYLLRLLV
jgi:menaquinone-9 beta-reductase